ncbi:MAG TPA: V-type ATP synthase subunit D [Firmicutes bacterium]|nr:V-type ATP synthase subunit D [Bacillota bacterium]
MEVRVNPNRMQLLRLKARLKTAQRGHKMLKDKRDELMRRFLDLVRQNKELRQKVEEKLGRAARRLLMATASASPAVIDEALAFPKQHLDLAVQQDTIMGVRVARFAFSWGGAGGEADLYPYGPAHTPADLDAAIKALSESLPDLLRLAEIEKAAELLAVEVEKTRRRVNALEYVLIPQLEETIKYITMKLDEAERGNLTRLMKIKALVHQG